ncbi:MAG: hypothetical protein JSU06_08240 [Actinobacteria bacterium]|nr:hypothetical protein [Actinomycetota bacterium]
MSAFAGGNSGEQVYETELPSVKNEPGGEKTATHHSSHNNPAAKGSEAETGGAGTGGGKKSGSGGAKSSEEGSSKEGEKNPSTAGGAGGGNKPNGGAGENGIGGAKEVGAPTQTGTHVAKSSGSSSPLVPILIAIVVLAAISIGVVLYRQRKSGQGGSDGRVSSSNAS